MAADPPTTTTTTTTTDPRAAPPGLWTVTTYFGQGFPYSIVINLANLYFVAQKASLEAVGLTSLFHLPWNLKAFVGPFVDAYGTKRRWLVGIELLLCVALLVFAFVASLSDVLVAASVMFLVVAVLSATHDIAIDGLYMEALDKKEQERLVGLRAPAWRVAMLVVTGPMAILCDKAGWTVGFAVMGLIVGALCAFHLLFLPRVEVQKKPLLELVRRAVSARFLGIAVVVAVLISGSRALWLSTWRVSVGESFTAAFPMLAPRIAKLSADTWIGLALLLVLAIGLAMLPMLRRRIEGSTSEYGRSFVAFLSQPYAGRVLLYVVTFRLGESLLQTMRFAFLKTELGVTQSEYGVAQGTLGVIAGLIAPIVGGLLIARFGLRRCIWPYLLAMNGLHLTFCAAALFAPQIAAAHSPVVGAVAGLVPVTLIDMRLVIVSAVLIIENFGAGLGTAAFLVYLLRCCMPGHKAAHMALLTSFMSISFTLSGVFSGFIAEFTGFPVFFALTFVLTIPGMALTLFVPHIDEQGSPPALGR
jgi:PAT family beta-lactamase induction signal transducer AmpG